MIMVLVNVCGEYQILCTLDRPSNERQDNYNVACLLSFLLRTPFHVFFGICNFLFQRCLGTEWWDYLLLAIHN